MKQKGFSKGCRDEVLRYEQESARDYRLNHRLYTACNRDVGAICLDACDVQQGEVCGGKVRSGKVCRGHKGSYSFSTLVEQG